MAREMIFLVEQLDSKRFKAVNVNFSIKVTASSYDEIKLYVKEEIGKLDFKARPESIRFRFVREEISEFKV